MLAACSSRQVRPAGLRYETGVLFHQNRSRKTKDQFKVYGLGARPLLKLNGNCGSHLLSEPLHGIHTDAGSRKLIDLPGCGQLLIKDKVSKALHILFSEIDAKTFGLLLDGFKIKILAIILDSQQHMLGYQTKANKDSIFGRFTFCLWIADFGLAYGVGRRITAQILFEFPKRVEPQGLQLSPFRVSPQRHKFPASIQSRTDKGDKAQVILRWPTP